MSDNDIDATEIVMPTKRVTGETLEDRLTENAYHRIIPARYSLKDENGDLEEEPEQLFERVAKNVSLAEILDVAKQNGETIEVQPEQIKPNASNRDKLVKKVFGEHATVDSDITVPLSEENIKHFAYDTLVPELPDEYANAVKAKREEFQDSMEHLSFMPNSPTLMNAGDELQQLSACFVNSPADSIDDIHEKVKEAAMIFKSGGGNGYEFNQRPHGDPVGSTGGIASGPISFMRTFDQMCETIAQGGKRRGAQMGMMRISHPDVVHFMHAKNKDISLKETLKLNDPDDYTHSTYGDALDEAKDLISEDGKVPEHLRNAAEGHLSNFNISVAVTDGFMEAVMNDEDYTFINPRTGEPHIATEGTKEMYSWHDLGEYVEVGEELTVPANVLWDHIIEGAHENGEPGVIFIDRVNDEHSFPVQSNAKYKYDDEDYSEYEIRATNPCGEQPLMQREACNLGHINLSTLASEDRPTWTEFREENADLDLEVAVSQFLNEAVDTDELSHRVKMGTHFLDNVVTMSDFEFGSDFQFDEIEKTVRDNRKIGLGIMGLAQLFIQLGVKYGSDVSDEVARQLMTSINHGSKQVSRDLAETRGKFNNWDDSKYADPTEYTEWFEKQTGEDATDWEDGYPIRNHNTTTIAPTGTTSMLGDTSGGCEPLYNVIYRKNVTEDVQGDEMLVEADDYFIRTLEANDIDSEAVLKEASEQMANNEFDGIEGLENVPNELQELFVTTGDLTGLEHASIQCALQKGVDSSISKTCNFPNSATKEDMQEVYEYVWKNGGKGVTVYRDGTRAKQVLTTRAKNTEFADESEAATALVEQIDSTFDDFNHFFESQEVQDYITEETMRSIGESIHAISGMDMGDNVIYADRRDRPSTLNGVTQRVDTGYGKVYVTINEDENGTPFELFANIGHSGGYTNSFTEALAKVISTALRSGVDPEELVDELVGTRSPKIAWDQGEQIQSIPDAIGTAINRYLNDEVDKGTPQQQSLDDVNQSTDDTDEAHAAVAGSATDTGGTSKQETKTATDEHEDITAELIKNGESPECPSCGATTLYYSEGCKSCESCGWSEC